MSNKFLEELVLPEQGLPSEVPAPGTVAVYTKPNGLYFMRSDAVEVGPILPQVAQPAPSNMATTDTIQTFTAAKTFTAAPTVPDNSFSIAKVNGLTTALADKYSATNPPPVTAPSNMVTTDTTQTISGAKTFSGTTGFYGASGNIKLTGGGAASFAGWIDMPTGLAGIGSGGVGQTTWVAVASASTQFFSDVTGGDTVYRGATGKTLRFGISNAGGTNASTMRVTESGVAVAGTLSATGNITENGVRVYSSNNPPPTTAPSNMVTTDTTQTITHSKTFNNTTTFGQQATFTIPAAADSVTTMVNSRTLQFSSSYWSSNTANYDSVGLRSDQQGTGNAQVALRVLGPLQAGGQVTNLDYLFRVRNTADSATVVRVGTDGYLYEGANRVYSAGNTPPAPSNMVTTDGDFQTITGRKVVTAGTEAAAGMFFVGPPTSVSDTFNSSTGIGFQTYRYDAGTTTNVAEVVTVYGKRGSSTANDLWLEVDRPVKATAIFDNGNRVYSAGNAPPAPSNMVTTDTAQTISGIKTIDSAGAVNFGVSSSTADGRYNSSTLNFRSKQVTSGTSLETTNTMKGVNEASYVGIDVTGNLRAAALYEGANRVVNTSDSRLSDARTPTAHTHGVADLSATGTRDATTFLRGDGTWATVSTSAPANMVTTDTAQTITGAKTISGAFRTTGTVAQAEAGVSRLDLGVEAGTPRVIFEDSAVTSGTVGRVWAVDNSNGSFRWFTPGVVRMSLAANGNLAVTGSITSAGTAVVLTNDSRLSDARTPTAHTHTASQISDSTTVGRSVLTAADAAAARTAIGAGTSSFSGAYSALSGIPTTFAPSAHTHGIADLSATGTRDATTFLRGDGTWAVVATGAPSNMVTTDTAQTISANKTFGSGFGLTFVSNSGSSRIQQVGTELRIHGLADAVAVTINDTTASFKGTLYEGTNRVYSAGNKVPVAGISATGTADATTYLRGDGTWTAVTSGGGTAANVVTSANTTANKYTVAPSTAPPASPAVGDVWLVNDLYTPGAPSGNGTVDLSNYVTLNSAQTITAVKTFSAAPVVPDSSFTIAKISATGTRDATTVLRGDGTFAPQSLPAIPFSMAGTATVKAGTFKFPIAVASVIDSVMITAGTAPAGSALIADVHVNGTSIYTTQANRPTLQPGVAIATAPAPNITALAAGDYISVDIDAVGSSTAGSDIMVVIRFRRA